MRLSLVFAAASTAVVTSASVLPRAAAAASAPNLPASSFPTFKTISIDDAKNEKDLPPEWNRTHTVQADPDFFSAQTAASAACSANPNVRIEWKSYSTQHRKNFIGAIKCLMNKPPSGKFSPATNRYEDFVRLHQMYMPEVHQNAKFLVWHRYYLWVFQMTLRKECGFNDPFPWWDETLVAGKFGTTDMFTSPDYFGHLPGPQNGNPVCITSGAFAGLTCHIGPGGGSTPHCLSRAGQASLTSQCNANFVNTCNSRSSYADMESCSEYGPHAYGHNGIGGVMSDVAASPSDPIFWMHHSFVDHSFRIWQNAAASRTTTINGKDHEGNPLTLDTTISVGGIFPDVKVRDVLNTMSGATIGGYPWCYRYNY
ncbi:hypothetical protein VTK73DRAFT_7236 [Phialemonium thermophilum]|uniref:Tyrosinase copper-binding domain-containing protein n=1 Tax=Phialemonium thermophilum TaxID=223376 RepID=A0ABR3WFL3_9PEZI